MKRSGLFLGLLAGAALGILYAPKKGKKLRDAIKQERTEGGMGLDSIKDGFIAMGKEIATSAKDTYESDEVQEQIGKARKKATSLAKQGEKEVRKAARKVGRKVTSKAKTAARTAKSKVKKATKRASTKVKRFTKKKIGK